MTIPHRRTHFSQYCVHLPRPLSSHPIKHHLTGMSSNGRTLEHSSPSLPMNTIRGPIRRFNSLALSINANCWLIPFVTTSIDECLWLREMRVRFSPCPNLFAVAVSWRFAFASGSCSPLSLFCRYGLPWQCLIAQTPSNIALLFSPPYCSL